MSVNEGRNIEMGFRAPSKLWYKEHRKELRLLGFSHLLLVVCLPLFSITVGLARGPYVLTKLAEELARISPPLDTQVIEYTDLNKLIYMVVREEYLTSLTLEEVRSYYDAELTKNGWQFSEKHAQFIYSTEMTYCKGNHTAILYYPGAYGEDLDYWRSYWNDRSPEIPFPGDNVTSGSHSYRGVYSVSMKWRGDCTLVKGWGLGILPFETSMFLLLASLPWTVFWLLIYHATQMMSDNELLGLWRYLRYKRRTGIRGTRVRSIIGLLLSTVGALYGGYNVVTYLFHWFFQVLIQLFAI